MKKYRTVFLAALSLLILSATTTPVFSWANSEGSCYAKGDKIGSAGVSFYYFGIYGAFDYGIHDCISAGAALGYNGVTYANVWRKNYIPIVVRGAFHPFNLDVLADKIVFRNILDVYAGLATGWAFGWATWKSGGEPLPGSEPKMPGFVIREYLGVRYFITDKWSLFVEDCAGVSNIAIGASYKF